MNFYKDILSHDPRFKSPKLCKDMTLLERGTNGAVVKLLALAKAAGHDLRVSETYRSQVRQHDLWLKKATQISTVGCHGWGLAADLQLFVEGKYQTRAEPYYFLLALCKQVGLISGLDWGHGHLNKQGDAGHVQRIPVFRQDGVGVGKWYPPEVYDPYLDMQANGIH